MANEPTGEKESNRQASPLIGAGRSDLILSALNHLLRIQPAGGETSGPPTIARQKKNLGEWARGLGLLLDADSIIPRLGRGGQEHDIVAEGDHVIKVTRNGVFGFSPGIDLALVASDEDARCFHLWEATPIEYLERLELHNQLIPDLNALVGILVQADGDLAIVTSQPRFDIVPVSEKEIDEWFAGKGFKKITESAYYRVEDNLGVFDAHTKNVIRAGDQLVPFDVIPCHPAEGFLQFVEDTLKAGHNLKTERKVTTTSRSESMK
ncbi:MAG TPA: hypothetical protein VGN23_09310 [Verrucomicrobiae bacterium]|jgi:hypothetical protein